MVGGESCFLDCFARGDVVGGAGADGDGVLAGTVGFQAGQNRRAHAAPPVRFIYNHADVGERRLLGVETTFANSQQHILIVQNEGFLVGDEGLDEAAQALVRALEGAGEQREDYWTNRIQPFLQVIWPKSRHLASKSIAESFARLSIAARGQFPAGLSAVLGWLKPLEHPHFVVHLLHESGLSRRFPEDALRLLDGIIEDQPWVPRELGECLTAIAEASPAQQQDYRYQRLTDYSRRRGK